MEKYNVDYSCDEEEELGEFIYKTSRVAKEETSNATDETTSAINSAERKKPGTVEHDDSEPPKKRRRSSRRGVARSKRNVQLGTESSNDEDPPTKRRASRRINNVATKKDAKKRAVATAKSNKRTQPARAAATAARTKLLIDVEKVEKVECITKLKQTYNYRWNEKLQELRSFKQKHGHVNVTGGLGEWLGAQRRFYRGKIKGEKNSLTDEREKALNDLGIVWERGRDRKDAALDRDTTKIDERWNRYLEELRSYKELHGHTNVPCKSGSLGKWVSHQRQYYKIRRGLLVGTKQKGAMTDERIKALNDLGFVWDAAKEGIGRKRGTRDMTEIDQQWDRNLEDLRLYKKKHGHTDIPREGYLGQWTYRQRTYYRSKLQGKKHFLTDERINALNEMGFTWESKKRGSDRRK